MLALRTAVLLVCLTLVQGCTTTLKVCPADSGTCPTSGNGKSKNIGVPYHLTRPDFLLSVEPPSDKSPLTTYQLNQANIPDRQREYWINIDPAWLTKTNFKLTFGTKGELASTTFGATEQVTPTLKALGEFTVAAIGAAAGVARKIMGRPLLDGGQVQTEEASSPAEQLKDRLNSLIGINKQPKCNDNSQVPTSTERQARNNMMDRMTKVIQLESKKDFATLFAYRDAEEKCWLQTTVTKLRDDINEKKEGNALKGYKNALKRAYTDYEGEKEGEDRAANVERSIETEFETGTDESLKKHLDRKEESLKESLKQLKEAIQKDPHPNNIDNKKKRLESLLGAFEALSEEAKRVFAEIVPLREQRALGERIVKLDVRAWRDRHAAYLETQMDNIERSLLEVGPNDPNRNAKEFNIKELQKERAFTIGAGKEYARAQQLEEFLKTVQWKTTAHGGKEPAMGDYEIARKELDILLTLMAQKRMALIPTTPTTPKKSRVERPKLWWVKDTKVSPDAVSKKFGGTDPAPEFVITIKEIEPEGRAH